MPSPVLVVASRKGFGRAGPLQLELVFVNAGMACAAETLWSYLAQTDGIEKADFIIGFGHFDARIAAQCASLYSQGWAPKVVFTGGVGSGSAGLAQPEAEFFMEEAVRLGVPVEDIIVEPRSTNTPENARFTLDLLSEQGLAGEPFDKTCILVATPYRQLRVDLTCRKLWPEARLLNCPPASSYAIDTGLFGEQCKALDPLLVGEIERIDKYGAKGDITPADVPAEIRAAAAAMLQAEAEAQVEAQMVVTEH